MWIDEHGRSHSEATASPERHLGADSQTHLLSLSGNAIASQLESLDGLLDELFDRVDGFVADPVEESKYVGVALPPEYVFHFLGGDLTVAVGAWLKALPVRWQLDAYFAVMSAIWEHLEARQDR